MTSIFNTALAITLLTHPLQVALIAVTLGALVRQGIGAWFEGQTHVIARATIAHIDVRAAA